MRKFLLLASILVSQFSNAQAQAPTPADDPKQKFSDALVAYFKPDRENIHLHLNKSIFLTGETIWFKGYVTEKKSGGPYIATSNVFINLIAPDGKILSNILCFSENSTFQGHLPISKELAGGTYFIQVYTNYMNNFNEDESTVYPISIVNITDTTFPNRSRLNYDTVDIKFYPEGGSFLAGTSNTLAVHIADCHGNGVAIKNAEIKDASGAVVTTFSTNEQGYGRFDITSTGGNGYSATIDINGFSMTRALPKASKTGVTLSANNYAVAQKTVLKIKTNAETLASKPNATYSLIIQRNENASYVNFGFKNNATEENLVLSADELAPGINTIFITDDKLNKLAERVIYKHNPTVGKSQLSLSAKRGDSVVIRGISPLMLGELSISVLPVESSSQPVVSMYEALQFDNYLASPVKKAAYYVNGYNRVKAFELDNVLLTKTSKYNWNDILSKPPQTKYTFDNGVTVKGVVNKNLEDKAGYKVNLNAYTLGLNEMSSINEKNEFVFSNVVAIDSVMLHFSLINKKEKLNEIKMAATVQDSKKRFMKPYAGIGPCPVVQDPLSQADFPKIDGAVQLDGVIVKAKVKTDTLSYTGRFQNNFARGYKITSSQAGTYRDLLSFIQNHGYDVENSASGVIIRSRSGKSFAGSRSPQVFVDDTPIEDFNLLYAYNLNDIDEIFINRNGFGGGAGSFNGIIRIYTKRGTAVPTNMRVKSQGYYVTNGFQAQKPFENLTYANVNSPGFNRFGTIHWEPRVNTDDKGSFRFAFPNFNQKSVKVIIEGIDSNGNQISEVSVIEL